jgi:hypothetical protein
LKGLWDFELFSVLEALGWIGLGVRSGREESRVIVIGIGKGRLGTER